MPAEDIVGAARICLSSEKQLCVIDMLYAVSNTGSEKVEGVTEHQIEDAVLHQLLVKIEAVARGFHCTTVTMAVPQWREELADLLVAAGYNETSGHLEMPTTENGWSRPTMMLLHEKNLLSTSGINNNSSISSSSNIGYSFASPGVDPMMASLAAALAEARSMMTAAAPTTSSSGDVDASADERLPIRQAVSATLALDTDLDELALNVGRLDSSILAMDASSESGSDNVDPTMKSLLTDLFAALNKEYSE